MPEKVEAEFNPFTDGNLVVVKQRASKYVEPLSTVLAAVSLNSVGSKSFSGKPQ